MFKNMPRTIQLCPINYLLYTLLVPPYLQLLFVCFFDLLLLDGKLFLKYKKFKSQFKLFERQLKKISYVSYDNKMSTKSSVSSEKIIPTSHILKILKILKKCTYSVTVHPPVIRRQWLF